MPALRILSSLFVLCALQGTVRAQPNGGEAAPEILTQTKCFGVLHESYDDWMAFLRDRAEPLDYVLIRLKYTRARYEHYRRKLDCSAITYRSDGHVVRGWLVHPKQQGNARLPVIVFNRDGNRAQGAVTFSQLFAHLFPLAERGYFVAVSQYRGVIPVPDEKRSPDQFGGDDVRDVTSLMRIAAAHPHADPRNFFMIGDGRGSIMSFRALQDSPVPVRAVASYSGIYDLHDLIRLRPEYRSLFRELIPGFGHQAAAELDKRSVNRWVSRLPEQTGVLILHGKDDQQRPTDSARAFAGQLKRLGLPHKAVYYDGESYLDEPTDEIRGEMLAWFNKFRH
jgi:dipeptidyl aminopeptidase/acylaminoacyl peptidase